MKKYCSLLFTSFIVSLLALFFTGCVSMEVEGDSFRYVKDFPKDKGIIYFYRTKQFAGSFISYDLWLEGASQPITQIHNGGYFPYIANPGKNIFFAKRTGSPMGLLTEKNVERLEINVKAGELYYVWCSVKGGGHPYFEQVTKEIAETDLKNCQLLPAYEKSK